MLDRVKFVVHGYYLGLALTVVSRRAQCFLGVN